MENQILNKFEQNIILPLTSSISMTQNDMSCQQVLTTILPNDNYALVTDGNNYYLIDKSALTNNVQSPQLTCEIVNFENKQKEDEFTNNLETVVDENLKNCLGNDEVENNVNEENNLSDANDDVIIIDNNSLCGDKNNIEDVIDLTNENNEDQKTRISDPIEISDDEDYDDIDDIDLANLNIPEAEMLLNCDDEINANVKAVGNCNVEAEVTQEQISAVKVLKEQLDTMMSLPIDPNLVKIEDDPIIILDEPEESLNEFKKDTVILEDPVENLKEVEESTVIIKEPEQSLNNFKECNVSATVPEGLTKTFIDEITDIANDDLINLNNAETELLLQCEGISSSSSENKINIKTRKAKSAVKVMKKLNETKSSKTAENKTLIRKIESGLLKQSTDLLKVEKPYNCDHCKKGFYFRPEIEAHLIVHVEEKPHNCKICGKGFNRLLSYRNHLLTHTGIRKHKCKQCQLSFYTLNTLNIHVRRVHEKEKRHKCTNCDKAFGSSSDLSTHMRVHTGDKPYACQQCSKSFTMSGNLKKHMLTHSGVKPFKCDQCPLAFAQRVNLNSHMKIHSAVKNIPCNICGKFYANTKYLKVHLKTHQNKKLKWTDFCK